MVVQTRALYQRVTTFPIFKRDPASVWNRSWPAHMGNILCVGAASILPQLCVNKTPSIQFVAFLSGANRGVVGCPLWLIYCGASVGLFLCLMMPTALYTSHHRAAAKTGIQYSAHGAAAISRLE